MPRSLLTDHATPGSCYFVRSRTFCCISKRPCPKLKNENNCQYNTSRGVHSRRNPTLYGATWNRHPAKWLLSNLSRRHARLDVAGTRGPWRGRRPYRLLRTHRRGGNGDRGDCSSGGAHSCGRGRKARCRVD